MKQKIGKIMIRLGLVLMFSALLLFLYNKWQEYEAKEAATEALDLLEDAIDENSAKAADNTAADAENDTDASDDTASDMDTVEIDGYYYIGKLSIPRFGLELPVMVEWSYDGMKTAPGRYQGTVATGDLVICGHNYSRHFGNLKDLVTGDTITFTDVNGNVFNYNVIEVETLAPTAISEMVGEDETDWDLTLFTCTIGGRARVTVRCQMLDEE